MGPGVGVCVSRYAGLNEERVLGKQCAIEAWLDIVAQCASGYNALPGSSQHSSAQHSTAQHSTAQHSAGHLSKGLPMDPLTSSSTITLRLGRWNDAAWMPVAQRQGRGAAG